MCILYTHMHLTFGLNQETLSILYANLKQTIDNDENEKKMHTQQSNSNNANHNEARKRKRYRQGKKEQKHA